MNVPAGRLTFVAALGASAAPPDGGASDGSDNDDDDGGGGGGGGGGGARPILGFVSGGAFARVRLRERDVAATHPAVGQINQVPGVWNPQWTGAWPWQRIIG